jgi:membrane-associated phospholipid phosphatase
MTDQDDSAGVRATVDAAALRRVDVLLWAIIAACAVIVALAAAGPFHLMWSSFVGPAAVTAGLLAGAHYYAAWRRELPLASALTVTAQLIAFAAVGAPLSYVAASLGWPAHDAAFAAADRALGFDWRALLAWMDAHPLLHALFALSYASFAAQATVTVMALAWARELVRLRTFMLAFVICTLVTIVISALAPAEGVWTTYGLPGPGHTLVIPDLSDLRSDFLTLHQLRTGAWRTLRALGSEGIISFPSLHTALGVIFPIALWRAPYVRWIGLAVNALMIGSVPIDGAHYFIDLLAGVVTALVSWTVATLIVRRVLAQPAGPYPLTESVTRR